MSEPLLATLETQCPRCTVLTCTHYTHLKLSTPAFTPAFFEEQYLEQHGLITGRAGAGRGTALFFQVDDQPLVLRPYRRGGMMRHFCKAHYLYTGLSRTRATREFDVMTTLNALGLPAPRPYACRVTRTGFIYQASLITHRLSGTTLTEFIGRALHTEQVPLSDQALWQDLGTMLARFHQAGLYHADLNAHNIMLNDQGVFSLIDFDRAEFRHIPPRPCHRGWCVDNMQRLERSLRKIAGLHAPDDPDLLNTLQQGFSVCTASWRSHLA